MKRIDWLLVLLDLPGHRQQPHMAMDRLRIMKTLFLLRKAPGLPLADFYRFSPYHYGPFSVDVYHDLDELEDRQLVERESTHPRNWARYSLTAQGSTEAQRLASTAPGSVVSKMEEFKELTTRMSFSALLNYVYDKYPEYAVASVVRSL